MGDSQPGESMYVFLGKFVVFCGCVVFGTKWKR